MRDGRAAVMNIINPHMLPKVRSKALTTACAHMPCTLRIASFIGLSCAAQDTVVGAHLPVFGKGMSTKVSDIHIAAGCFTCHNLLDFERDPRGLKMMKLYPNAFFDRLFQAQCETLSRWIQSGAVIVPDAEFLI